MDSRERFLSVMDFRKPDRALLWEMGYWAETLERWYREGLLRRQGFTKDPVPGEGVRAEASAHDLFTRTRMRDGDVHEALGFDVGIVALPVNSGPQPPFELLIIEENENFKVVQDELGVIKKINKKEASIPQFIDFQVKTRADFERIVRERFQPELKNRVPENWEQLAQGYAGRDYPLAIGGYPYGFYGFLRYLMGEERLLYNFYDDPRLIKDLMGFLADFWIELWDQALARVAVDCAFFWEDMSYKQGPLISPAMFREFIMPCYQRVAGFLKSRGVNVLMVDTDGNLDALIPLFLESGLTGIFPIEVQAGNDLLRIRRNYPRLQLMGGIDKLQVARGRGAIDTELEAKVPIMLDAGGYVPHLDHLVQPEVSWENFSYYRKRLSELIKGGG